MLNHPGRNDAAAGASRREIAPLNLPAGLTGDSDEVGPFGAIAVDVETTGLSPKSGRIIELAMRRFRYDRKGIITQIGEPYQWREDPAEPLDPRYRQLLAFPMPILRVRRLMRVLPHGC